MFCIAFIGVYVYVWDICYEMCAMKCVCYEIGAMNLVWYEISDMKNYAMRWADSE